MRKFTGIGFFLFLLIGISLSGILFAQNELQTAFEKVKKGYETTHYHAIVMDTVAVPHRREREPSAGKIKYRIEKWEIWYDGPERLRLARISANRKRSLIIIKKGEKFYTKFRDSWVERPILQRGKNRVREFPIRIRGESYVKLLEKNYSIQLKPDGTIANRPAELFSILPNYPGRMLWKIWLDAQSGIILRQVQQIETPRGLKIIKAKRVAAIEYKKSFPDSLFAVNGKVVEKRRAFGGREKEHMGRNNRRFRSLEDLTKAAPYAIYLPSPLPKGFAFVEGRFAHRRHMILIQSHFSDGIIDFSIFQIDASAKMENQFLRYSRMHHPPEGRRPPMEIIPFRKDGFAFLIMGNVPVPWLQKLVHRMQPYPAEKNP